MDRLFDEYDKAEALMAQARDWARANRDAWWWMCMEGAARASQGRRFGIGDLAEEVRWRRRAEGGGGFKLNNNLRAPLARMMAQQYPQVAPYIEMRASVVDTAGVA